MLIRNLEGELRKKIELNLKKTKTIQFIFPAITLASFTTLERNIY